MILITGLTGNTGSHLLKLFKKGNFPIVAITRNESHISNSYIIYEYGNVDDEVFLKKVIEKYGISEIIHIANIRYSPLILKVADFYRINRVILIHTTGVYSKYREYSQLYKQIESEILSKSYENTSFVILRPTMIYGNERDHNMHKLIKFLNKYRIFPIFGDGSAKMQPIHVEDLAMAIYLVFQKKNIRNEDFDISGGTIEEYKTILNYITKNLDRKVFFINIPMKLAILLTKLYNKFPKAIITVEQVERLQEDKAYTYQKAHDWFGFNPRSFEQGIETEIAILKEKGIIT